MAEVKEFPKMPRGKSVELPREFHYRVQTASFKRGITVKQFVMSVLEKEITRLERVKVTRE